MNFRKTFANIIYIGTAAILITGIVILLKGDSARRSFFTLLTIESDSMKPVLRTGDVILIYRSSDYRTGDIISYQLDTHKILTHRIISMQKRGNTLFYLTKGDTNNTLDKEVAFSRVIGKVVLIIPAIGLLRNIVFSQSGYLLYMGFLFVIIVVNMIYIVKEMRCSLRV